MNRLIIASAIALTATMGLQAGELDMVSRARLRLDRLELAGKLDNDPATQRLRAIKRQLGAGEAQSLGMIVISDGATESDLEAEGVKILRRRGNIALVAVDTRDVERVASLKCVSRMQLARRFTPKLDRARASSGVDAIHAGTEGLDRAYTGAGVITGIVDAGMDPNHVNFLDASGNSRVSYLGHLRMNSGGTTLLETRYGTLNELSVSDFKTDDPTQYHGTHTMGIMAGGYKGTATVATGDPSTGLATIEEKANPYHGVAPGADIAASCGDLMDMLIAMGIDDICQYAYNQGDRRRTVINLSLGSNIGPHDGSDVIHQFIKQIVDQDNAIICVSAGNEGDLPIALHGTFGDDCKELKSFIRPYVYTDMRYGNLVIYSEDATEFTVQAVVYNKSRGRVAFSLPVDHNLEGSATYYVSSEDMKNSSTDIVSSTLARAFDGYIGVGSMTDPDNGRYYAMIDYYCVDSETNNGNYLLGFMVTPNDGSAGKRVDIFGDGQFCAFDSYGIEGWNDGMFDGTISDMACGRDILVVGSYNTRDDWGALDGYAYGYDGRFPAGKVTSFSSYGRLLDGREVPHVCAPGAAIVSSANSYFVADPSNGITNSSIIASATGADGRSYPWVQTTGTSMACPFVAGSIALWLEADNTLDINDVKDIVATTAVRDNDVTSSTEPLQWGAGKFDALGGLKEVLRRKSAGIGSITAPADDRLIVDNDGAGNISLFLGGAESIVAEIFDLGGSLIATSSAPTDELTLETSTLKPGVYIVRVNDIHTTKILVK